MANTDSTIDSELILLHDNWPGEVEPRPAPYGSGLLDKRYQNVAAPSLEAGTKVQFYNSALGKPGPTILIYLQAGTAGGGGAIAAKTAVVQQPATLWYQVTNDPDTVNLALPSILGAYAIAACADASWGWFWCGGVCPEEFVPAMGGTYMTAGTLVAGGFIFHDLSQDYIGLDKCSAVNEAQAGFSLAADA